MTSVEVIKVQEPIGLGLDAAYHWKELRLVRDRRRILGFASAFAHTDAPGAELPSPVSRESASTFK